MFEFVFGDLARCDGLRPISLEFCPDLLVATACAGQPSNPASLVLGIEGSKLSELHGKAVRRATQETRKRDDFGIGLVHPTEWESEVEAAGYAEFLECPKLVLGRGHCLTIMAEGKSVGSASLELI